MLTVVIEVESETAMVFEEDIDMIERGKEKKIKGLTALVYFMFRS